MLTEMAVCDQVLDQEHLHVEDTKASDQSEGHLVPEVQPLVVNLLMQFGYLPSGLLPALSAFDLPR